MGRVPKTIRDKIYTEFVQKYHHKSFNIRCPTECCSNYITPFNFEAGHIIANEDNSDNNLIPICNKCNKSMGTNNMIDWIKSNNRNPNWIHDYVENESTTKSENIIMEVNYSRFFPGFSDNRNDIVIIKKSNSVFGEIISIKYEDYMDKIFNVKYLNSIQENEYVIFDNYICKNISAIDAKLLIDKNIKKLNFELLYLLLEQYMNNPKICRCNYIKFSNTPNIHKIYNKPIELLIYVVKKFNIKLSSIYALSELNLVNCIINNNEVDWDEFQISNWLTIDYGQCNKVAQKSDIMLFYCKMNFWKKI